MNMNGKISDHEWHLLILKAKGTWKNLAARLEQHGLTCRDLYQEFVRHCAFEFSAKKVSLPETVATWCVSVFVNS